MPVKHAAGGNVLGEKPVGTITLASQRPYLIFQISVSIVLLGGKTTQNLFYLRTLPPMSPVVMCLIPVKYHQYQQFIYSRKKKLR